MNKKVLIIAYHFPPSGGGGVQRTLKFVKYLEDFGWKPVVLTASNPDDPIVDKSLADEIPNEIKVYRTFSFEITRYEKNLSLWVKSLNKKDGSNEFHASNSHHNKNGLDLKNVLKKIYLFLTFWLRIPDSKVGWLPSAFLKSLSIIYSERIDLIFVTSPPHSSQLLGLLLKKLTRKPLVADFRDEWIEKDFMLKYQGLSRDRIKFEKYLSSKVLRNVTTVIANTEVRKQMSLEAYPFISLIQVIPNGYDAEDMYRAKANCRGHADTKFHICHTGYLYPRTAFPFFEAFRELLQEKPEFSNKIQFDLVGYLEKEYQVFVLDNKLTANVKIWGHLRHIDSVTFLLKSQLLLYLMGDEFGKGTIAGKLYEYLASGRPILGVVPTTGASASLIEKTKSGWVIDSKDKLGIKCKLIDLFETYSRQGLRTDNDWSVIEDFERRTLTRKLASVFDQCVMTRSQRS